MQDNRKHWAVTFDKTLRYLGAKEHVPDLCAPTEPVGPPREKLRGNSKRRRTRRLPERTAKVTENKKAKTKAKEEEKKKEREKGKEKDKTNAKANANQKAKANAKDNT